MSFCQGGLTDSVQLRANKTIAVADGGSTFKIGPAAATATPLACQLQSLLGLGPTWGTVSKATNTAAVFRVLDLNRDDVRVNEVQLFRVATRHDARAEFLRVQFRQY